MSYQTSSYGGSQKNGRGYDSSAGRTNVRAPVPIAVTKKSVCAVLLTFHRRSNYSLVLHLTVEPHAISLPSRYNQRMQATAQPTIQSYTRGGRGTDLINHINPNAARLQLEQQLHKQLQYYDYPTCGDCWCIPDDNSFSNNNCPDWSPINTYPPQLIAEYEELIPNSIYTLDCNPYRDAYEEESSSCTTQPPQQQFADVDEAVCALKYTCRNNDATTATATSYDMISYPSWDDAVADEVIVTHVGACGLCSTTADLAAYMNNPNLESDSIICVTKGLFSYDAGMDCFMDDIGLTKECANIWLLDGYHTTAKCTGRCLKELEEYDGSVPTNGDPPDCALSDCFQCDEDESGGIFTEFAGRNRRRSCLLSSIVRGCDKFTEIVHVVPPDCNTANGGGGDDIGMFFEDGEDVSLERVVL